MGNRLVKFFGEQSLKSIYYVPESEEKGRYLFKNIGMFF